MKKNYLLILLLILSFAGSAQPGNNDCSNAIELTISQDINCSTPVNGTVLNATPSAGTVSCGGSADDDVWYWFTAIYDSASITVSNLSSLTAVMQYEIYESSCTGPSVMCATTYNNTFTANVTPGINYYIRLYTVTGAANPPADTDFTICMVTPPPGISVSTSQYTPQQLVQSVFVAQPGLNVTNITSSTGSSLTAGQPNGLGYFSQSDSPFPFEDGILLSTGSAKAAEGPNGNIQSAGTTAWGGDAQLNTTIGGLSSKNATVLEFNFVPSADNLAFSFLYASEEYGTFQCDYGDAFAILLTDNATGLTVNLGVVPGTTTPISSYSVRNGAYNSACAGANVSYFGTFYQPGVVDGPINFNGRTQPFFVDTPIIAGHNYHIKFVIADRTDEQFDSALFLNGGSFNIGAPIPPDDNIQISALQPYAVCDDDNDGFALFDLAGHVPQILGAVSPFGNYNVTYFENPGDAETGENAISIIGGYTNNVSLEQTLYVRVTLVGNTDIYAVATLDIVANPSPIYEDNLPAIAICPGTATDLTVNVSELWNISQYTVTYHLTEVADVAGTPAITQPQAFTSQSDEVFTWVRITDPETGCFEVLLQPVLTWAAFVVVNIDEANVAVWYEDEVDGFDFTLALNGVSTTQNIFTLAELNYCNNTLTVTNTTCNTSVDIFFSIYPPAPNAESPQIFTEGQTLADLEVEGTGISWFTAAMGGSFLNMDTPLQDGVTYYAAQFIDNCAGIDRLPVTANLVAGLNSNSLATMHCYPNPVKNELMLEHSATLQSAILYNTLGQEVLHAKINNTAATLNLGNLANGIYLMKVQAENDEKTIKIVKE